MRLLVSSAFIGILCVYSYQFCLFAYPFFIHDKDIYVPITFVYLCQIRLCTSNSFIHIKFVYSYRIRLFVHSYQRISLFF